VPDPLESSPVRYAKSGDVFVAYRVFGSGDQDIVLIPGTISHVELLWEVPVYEYLLKRLASFARIIVFDKPGQGLSDRVPQLSLEERVGDVIAVMDAARSKRATLYGWSEGGQMSMMFAATYPERTTSLILYGTYASQKGEPWFLKENDLGWFLHQMEKHWGEGALPQLYAPSLAKDENTVRWFAKIERASASPGSILAMFRTQFESDVNRILPAVRVPTLALHRAADALVSMR